jgi:hypothetical protein
MSRAPASGPGKEGKVEGSQLRLYKAKEGIGNMKHWMLKYPRFANPSLIKVSAARASAEP